MADNVKDLVVRLSFEHGDTKSQISAIKNEIKLLDSGFKAAAAAAGGLSGGMNTAAQQADTLRRQIDLQGQAVDKYGTAIKSVQDRLKNAQDRQKNYGAELDRAKQRHETLVKAIDGQKKALAAAEKTGKTNTAGYQKMQQRLASLNAELDGNEKNIKDLEKGYARADKSIASADKNLQKLTIEQNEAKAAMAGMKKQLDQLDGSFNKHSASLEKASVKWKAYSDAAISAGQAQERVGRTLNKGSAAIVAAGVASAGAAVNWESSFAGVRKTVNGTAEDLEAIEDGLLNMGEAIPSTYADLAGIAENAGQLGIATENVLDFTHTMADLAETTDLTADSASEGFAQYANITQMAQKNIGRLGSVTVELGNNLATTESKILNFSQRIAAAGKQAGLTDAQIFGLAGGLSSLGLEAEMGGTAFSKALSGMQVAVETNSEELKDYARVAGMTAEGFAQAFRDDAAGAFVSFVQGLSSGSESAIVMLEEMGITETRMRDALLRASNASDLLTKSMEMANRAWDENTALTREAGIRYGTDASKLQILGNRVQRVAIQFGKSLTPALETGMDAVDKIVDKFAGLDENQRKQILTWGAYAASVGPTITLIGKANTAFGAFAGKISGAASAMAGAASPMQGLIGGAKALLGPMGIAALAVGAGYAAVKFVEWASGAKAAEEALDSMADAAQRMKETQAETLYDQASGDPLARFGLNKEDFTGSASTAQSWMDQLTQVWRDGKKETDEQVQQFTDSFAKASDGVREKIEGRGSLLEGLGAMDESTRAQMQADLAQLDAWDKEVADLLAKRQNGMLSAKDQARLDEVIKLRAELELEYGGGAQSGYEKIIGGMQAEIDRMLARGQGTNADPSLYADTLMGLAEGRKAYNEALDASYDSQHAQIMAIEDEAQRTAALAALNEQYNAQRLQGEQAYQQAAYQAAQQAWDATGMQQQVDALDELAEMLGSGETDPAKLAEWTQQMDEGKMASMIAMAEQLAATGDPESVKNLEDIRSKIQQIAAIASEQGLEGLADIFGEAIPEEVLRIVAELDMEGATETWENWKTDKETLTTTNSINIQLNPVDQAAIDAWEKENSGIELDGPKAKVGVKLGATWKSELKTAIDAGILTIYGADGKELPITPEIINQLDGNDIIALADDGTYHLIITPELGSTEAVETALAQLGKDPGEGTIIAPLTSSTQQDMDAIQGMIDTIDEYQRRIDTMKQNGEIFDERSYSVSDYENGRISLFCEDIVIERFTKLW